MGAFFTNVQVHTGDRSADQVRADIIEAVREWVLTDPFVEVTDTDEVIDRTVLVAPVGPGPWIAVYDELTESQELNVLIELTQILSSAVKGAAIGILVHDSDVLELRLCREGKLVDAYSNWPDYFGEVSPRERQELVGKPKVWRDFLSAGATPQDLRAVWDKSLSTSSIPDITPLLGLSPERCWTGLHYLSEKQTLSGFTRLSFRSTKPPSCKIETKNPPVLEPGSYSPEAVSLVGETLELNVGVVSAGGSSRGLTAVVWGPALAQGLVEPIDIRLCLGSGHQVTEAVFEPGQTAEGHVRFVRLPNFDLPAGLVDPYTTFSLAELGEKKRIWEIILDTTITVIVRSRVVAPGNGLLHIGFKPHANPQEGQTSRTIQLWVTDPNRRPLRCKTGSKDLSKLQIPRQLVALVALGADRQTCAEVAGDAIERWNTVVCPDSDGQYEIILQPKPHTQPKTSKLLAEDIPQGHLWQKLRQELTTCQILTGRLLSEFSGHPDDGPGGFTLDASSSPFHQAQDSLVPHFALWLNLAEFEMHPPNVVEEALTALVDNVMVRAKGLQAFVARWDWVPAYGVQSTPYEVVCGVHGQCTTGRAWCTRFLRGASEQIWLGSELLAQLDDITHLESIADVTPVGNGMRVVLKEATSLEVLERAMESLLPGRKDWQQALRQI